MEEEETLNEEYKDSITPNSDTQLGK